MIAKTKLPIQETVFSCTDATHYRQFIQETRATGVIPDVESYGFLWKVIRPEVTPVHIVDQRLPTCATSVMTLSGGSVMYLT